MYREDRRKTLTTLNYLFFHHNNDYWTSLNEKENGAYIYIYIKKDGERWNSIYIFIYIYIDT